MGTEVGNTIDTIWHRVVDKGLSFVVLIVVLYYMYQMHRETQAKLDSTNARFTEYILTNQTVLIQTLQNNTTAINNLTAITATSKKK